MKFIYVRIPVVVWEGETSWRHELSVRMFVPDEQTPERTVERLGEMLEEKLNTVDLGDDT